jgi:hypothetical protein
MKNLFFLLAVVLIFAQNVFGQETDPQKTDPKVTIQISPFSALFDAAASIDTDTRFIIDLEGQFKINNIFNFSLGVSSLLAKRDAGYYWSEADERDIYDNAERNIFQIRLRPMFIYRPFEKGLKGFYIGYYIPSVGFLYIYNDKESKLYTEIGTGINIGYKWVFRNGFTMQLGGGVGKTFSLPEKPEQYINMNADGSMIIRSTDLFLCDFKLGYSF